MYNKRTKKDLWLAIEDYHFNHIVEPHLWDKITETFGGKDASTKAFAEKIAGKLGWKKDFALLAIDEYKKFVYLAIISDFAVTPSKIIDQIWHEHILFTAGYRTFCSDVIKYSLDHNPELVKNPEQTGVFSSQYLATIDLYKTEFNINPPEVIWGTTKFNKENLLFETNRPEVKRKKRDEATSDSYVYQSEPLHQLFVVHGDDKFQHEDQESFSGFGGGKFGGAGAGSDWQNESTHETSSNHSHSNQHSSDFSEPSSHSDDSGTSSSESSSSCSSSSCGSSCGGGGD